MKEINTNLEKGINNTNTNKEESKMNQYEINTKENEINEVGYTLDYQKRNGAVIPVIDGKEHPELLMQYTSQSDLEAGMKVLKDALTATHGNIYKAMEYMYTAALATARGITPNKQVEILGEQVMISYEDRKSYTLRSQEICNLDDYEGLDMSEQVIEKILVERTTEKLKKERARAVYTCDYDGCDYDGDDYDEENEEYED